jgi:DNA repair exonuclease SbcCD ATPase subunit
VLKIKDPIHRQKIALKAMDAILFGPSDHYKNNRMKDILLSISLLLAISGCWYAFHQKKASQMQIKKMMKDIDSLSKAENQLMTLQDELDHARTQQQGLLTEKQKLEQKLKNEIERLHNEKQEMSSASSLPNIHEFGRVQELEEELREAREQLSRANKAWTPPHQLQMWLQLTHELELKHYQAKKLAAEQQLAAAKDGVSIIFHAHLG